MINLDTIRSRWKDRMLVIAFVVSTWSKEPEGQRHGAVIARDGKYILATGYNGPNRDRIPNQVGQDDVIHAEVNALRNLREQGLDAHNCVVYVSKKPCQGCMDALDEAGVGAMFWLQGVSGQEGYTLFDGLPIP